MASIPALLTRIGTGNVALSTVHVEERQLSVRPMMTSEGGRTALTKVKVGHSIFVARILALYDELRCRIVTIVLASVPALTMTPKRTLGSFPSS